MNLDLGVWFMGGATVVGLLQWLKTFMPKKTPSFIWGLFALGASLGWVLCPPEVRLGLGVLTVSQIGYELIIQGIKGLVEKNLPTKKEP